MTWSRPGPGFNSSLDSCACVVPATRRAAIATAIFSVIVCLLAPVRLLDSRGVQRELLHHVVVIAGRIENEVERLRHALLIGGARHDDVIAGALRAITVSPRPEGKAAQVFAQFGHAPRAAAIGGDADVTDAEAAVPRDAAHFRVAPDGDLFAVLDVGDHR